ncbi:mRNA export factor Gle1 [Leguminivora glycinivorella]|uniref:mRNA export factor Gle1 n=1 Tax=Leguminivora glycinivorella TaxID=1035111 RepID=UPI002010BD11|nr:mRNA export factor Gle1 [Leguminivora glycinivorella]
MGDIYETSEYKSRCKSLDESISDQLVDFERLRISALTKAAEISPVVRQVTIGPRSPAKKELQYEENLEVSPKPRIVEEDLVDDRVSDDLRYALIIKQYEKNLRDTSDELFNNLLNSMLARRAESMRNYWAKQSEECERRARELREKKLQMLQHLHDNDNLTVLEQAKLDEKNAQISNKQTIENMNRILEEQNQATARFAAVTDSHTKICICYNEITNMLQKDPQGKAVCEKYIPAINSVIGNISAIMDLCKTGALTDKSVKQAEVLVSNIENIRKKMTEELANIKKQELIKKQEEEAQQQEILRQKQLEEKRVQEAKAAEIAQIEKSLTDQQKKSQPMFYSQNNYNYFQELKNFLDQYENQYKGLLENVNMKKFRFDCQKAVNTPVNAISSVSGMHMKDKFDKLAKLLRGEQVQVLDTYVTATQHPQGLYYCTALLAKKIVRQGDLLVSSNPEAAFPLAAVTAALWSQFPEFGKLLEAYFHRFCPYLVPMFLPQKEGQTDKDFYLSRGYTYNDEGVVEKQDKFLKRMSGIFRLRCAIWIAKTPRFVNAPNPHGPRFGWQWLASFVNLKPEPDISATLINDFFSVCGAEFHKLYGKQFVKIIRLISSEYLAILENIDEGGPKTRLEVFLQEVLKTGVIQPPTGILPPNTW